MDDEHRIKSWKSEFMYRRSTLGSCLFFVGRAAAMLISSLQNQARTAIRWFNIRSLFVLNCLVLILNVLFYVLSTHLLNSPLEVYFLSPLGPQDKDLLDRTFRVFIETVEAANLTYFIYGGTLIGSLRHHSRIPWDDDVDIIMRAVDKPRITEVLSKLDPDYGLHMTGSDYYASQWKFYPTSGRFVFHRQYRTPYIDLFFYRENDTHVWNASPEYSQTELWLKRHIFPLHRRPFGDFSVAAPCNGPAVIGRHFDITVCRSREFSHMLEIPLFSKPLSVPCSRLAHIYPFVRRSRHSNGSSLVRETLMLGNWSIRRITTHAMC